MFKQRFSHRFYVTSQSLSDCNSKQGTILPLACRLIIKKANNIKLIYAEDS